MAMTRRDFLQASLATLAACAAPKAGGPGGSPRANGPTRILILGGTGFLGPALVEAARARGDVVNLFNSSSPTRAGSPTWSNSRATGTGSSRRSRAAGGTW